jgi:hypothetical protein
MGTAVNARQKRSVPSERNEAGHVATTFGNDLLAVYIVRMNRRPTNRHQSELNVAACDAQLRDVSTHAHIKAEEKHGS